MPRPRHAPNGRVLFDPTSTHLQLVSAPAHRVDTRLTQGKSPAWLGFDSAPLELPGTPASPFQCRRLPVAGETLVYAPAFHLLFDKSRSDAWYNLPGGASESRFGPGYGRASPSG